MVADRVAKIFVLFHLDWYDVLDILGTYFWVKTRRCGGMENEIYQSLYLHEYESMRNGMRWIFLS